MHLDWRVHFDKIVLPTVKEYFLSERELSAACSGQHPDLDHFRFEALRRAGAASFYLHHFSDVVANEWPEFLPSPGEYDRLKKVRDFVSERCFYSRSEEPSNDVHLLGEVADALKHSVLTRRTAKREILGKDQVLIVGRGFGTLRHGEGKYGGVEEVFIQGRSGTRAFSNVLHNVLDAWCRAANFELLEKG